MNCSHRYHDLNDGVTHRTFNHNELNGNEGTSKKYILCVLAAASRHHIHYIVGLPLVLLPGISAWFFGGNLILISRTVSVLLH